MIDAMSEYTMSIKMVNGNNLTVKWKDWPSRFMYKELRPHSQAGVQFISNKGDRVFIPWHQIEQSSLEEKILYNNTGEV